MNNKQTDTSVQQCLTKNNYLKFNANFTSISQESLVYCLLSMSSLDIVPIPSTASEHQWRAWRWRTGDDGIIKVTSCRLNFVFSSPFLNVTNKRKRNESGCCIICVGSTGSGKVHYRYRIVIYFNITNQNI